jgi:hypothetical protein
MEQANCILFLQQRRTHPIVLLLRREGLVGENNLAFYVLTELNNKWLTMTISLSLPKREIRESL